MAFRLSWHAKLRRCMCRADGSALEHPEGPTAASGEIIDGSASHATCPQSCTRLAFSLGLYRDSTVLVGSLQGEGHHNSCEGAPIAAIDSRDTSATSAYPCVSHTHIHTHTHTHTYAMSGNLGPPNSAPLPSSFDENAYVTTTHSLGLSTTVLSPRLILTPPATFIMKTPSTRYGGASGRSPSSHSAAA